ncbi:hypothetical protein Hypma_005155 [Hypsizygus marmoreus]|uniref:Uncharacterized protein n=1 Tax=Hypsizygus marmoreus TaxID=39966 RepID=A0A369K0Q1_HYPMA|nr:hypothetical protein Hypma_005155 [Hypsizygus marmoreus]
MARPKLHHTPEEKLAANREKSKRHYQRYKTEIQAKRSYKYHARPKKIEIIPADIPSEQNPAQSKKLIPYKQNPAQSKKVIPNVDRQLAYWCGRVERVAVKLEKSIGPSSFHHVDTVCTQYLSSHDKDDINDAIIKISPLQCSINRYQDEILQVSGVSEEWQRSEDVARSVREVIQNLEELLCTAMVGYDDLVSLHRAKKCMYQL